MMELHRGEHRDPRGLGRIDEETDEVAGQSFIRACNRLKEEWQRDPARSNIVSKLLVLHERHPFSAKLEDISSWVGHWVQEGEIPPRSDVYLTTLERLCSYVERDGKS